MVTPSSMKKKLWDQQIGVGAHISNWHFPCQGLCKLCVSYNVISFLSNLHEYINLIEVNFTSKLGKFLCTFIYPGFVVLVFIVHNLVCTKLFFLEFERYLPQPNDRAMNLLTKLYIINSFNVIHFNYTFLNSSSIYNSVNTLGLLPLI